MKAIAREPIRQAIAFVFALVAATAIVLALNEVHLKKGASILDGFRELFPWMGLMLTLAPLAYAALTAFAFSRMHGKQLAALVRSTSPRTAAGRRRWRWLGLDELTTALGYALWALVMVVFRLTSDRFTNSPTFTFAILGAVVGAWTMIIVAFAVRYLRAWALNSTHISLGDRLEEPIAFSDFVWLSVQLSTSYASGHVFLRTRELRRIATTQTVLAFAFNSTIIVLLVSVLLPTIL